MRNPFVGWTLVLVVSWAGFACGTVADPAGQPDPASGSADGSPDRDDPRDFPDGGDAPSSPDGGDAPSSVDGSDAPSSPERDAMIEACREACHAVPECTPPETLEACVALCDDNEAHDDCLALHTAEYKCMAAEGYICIGSQRATHGACETEFRATSHCEALASTPPGGEAIRAACHQRCANYRACTSDATSEEECRWSCDRQVGDTFAECVAAALALAECELDAASCVDGEWVVTGDRCATARFESESCHQRALKCEGALEDGQCPAVSCSCYGQIISYNRPEILGKTCRCPTMTDCMRNVCPF